MQMLYMKMMIVSGWVLAMAAVGIVSEMASASSWTGLALLTVIPPVALWQFWNPPSQSMSESIQKILR